MLFSEDGPSLKRPGSTLKNASVNMYKTKNICLVLCELVLSVIFPILLNGIVPAISRRSVQGWTYSFTWVFGFLANDMDSVKKQPIHLVSEVLGIMLLGHIFLMTARQPWGCVPFFGGWMLEICTHGGSCGIDGVGEKGGMDVNVH